MKEIFIPQRPWDCPWVSKDGDAHVLPYIGVFSAFASFHMIVLVLIIRFQVQGEIARLNREKPYDYNIHVHEK